MREITGAWTCGCDLSPVASNEKTRTTGNQYSYPKEYSGSMNGQDFQEPLGETVPARPKKPREHL